MSRRDPAQLAQAAIARAQALVDDWGRHGPPRRPRNGHTANCPNWAEPARWHSRCGLCWAETQGRPEPSTVDTGARNGLNVGAEKGRPPANPQVSELAACSRCYAPTTDPEGHCPLPIPSPTPSPIPSVTELPHPDTPATAEAVTPGAYCDPEGARGRTDTGRPMTCIRKPGETRPRWRTT